MWLQPLSQWFVAAVLLAQTSAGVSLSSLSQPALPELIVTRHTCFAIGFTPADLVQQPPEVQLYVSNDRGANWQLYAKVPPAQKQFTFRAGGDGEYWFVIPALDSSGKPLSPTIGPPGMRVLVDTRPPVLKLTTRVVQPGQVSVRWEVDKSTLKPDSLGIQYRALPQGPWQTVLPNPPAGAAANTAAHGETIIGLKPGEAEIQIRGEVVDTAGNMGFGHAQVKADEPADSRQIAASIPTQSPAPAARSDAATSTTQSDLAVQPVRVQPRALVRREMLKANETPKDDETKGSVAISINPPIGKQIASSETLADATTSIPGLPAGVRPRMVNSRLFELEYDIDSVGPSGVGRVELWATRDGGQTWSRNMLANDHRSPLLVSVEEEGVYGFRVVVANGAGVGGNPPKRGELPDIWVGVDVTKPSARIISVRQGTDAEAGHLVITWKAEDLWLAARPISLSFSEGIAGPWLPIASGLENTGRYAWPIDNRTPPRVYVQMEVRDEAGNVTVQGTTEAVAIDQSRPSVRIRDVHSLGHTGSRPVCESAAR